MLFLIKMSNSLANMAQLSTTWLHIYSLIRSKVAVDADWTKTLNINNFVPLFVSRKENNRVKMKDDKTGWCH